MTRAENEAAAWRDLDRRSRDADAYAAAHQLRLGVNVWHAILDDAIRLRAAAGEPPPDTWTADYLKGYAQGLKEAESSGVLQAVLDAINGTLDPHTQIADHPNVKFAQMERLKWTGLMAGFAPAPTDRTTTNSGDQGGPSEQPRPAGDPP